VANNDVLLQREEAYGLLLKNLLKGVDKAYQPDMTHQELNRAIAVCNKWISGYDIACPGLEKATSYRKRFTQARDKLRNTPHIVNPEQVSVVLKCPDCGNEVTEPINEHFGQVPLCYKCDAPSGVPCQLIKVKIKENV